MDISCPGKKFFIGVRRQVNVILKGVLEIPSVIFENCFGLAVSQRDLFKHDYKSGAKRIDGFNGEIIFGL